MNILSPSKVKQIGQNKYELDDVLSRQFVNGYKFGEVLKELLIITHEVEVKLLQYKDGTQKEERIFNWGLNEKYFKLYGLPLSDELKNQFIRGDHQKANILLKNLLKYSLSQLQRIIDQKKQNQVQLAENQKIYEEDLELRQQNPKNLFDFIMFSLKIELKLQTHEQVIALLAERNKFLSKIIILGLKQDFTYIINWFTYVFDNLDQIINYLKQDASNLVLFLDLTKISLISKEPKICKLGLEILQHLVKYGPQFRPQFETWFIENNVLQIYLSTFNKHAFLQKQILSFLPTIGDQLIFSINSTDRYEYLTIISLLFVSFSQNQQCSMAMVKRGFINTLIGIALQQFELDMQDRNFRLISLTLLNDIWSQFYDSIQQQQQVTIFNQLKKCVRSKYQVLQHYGINQMIKLLDHFASQKSQNAPYIYKTLVFFLIELHENVTIREIVLVNFSNLFQKFHQMPVQLLLTPLIKQIQEGKDKTYVINTFDIDFFKSIVDHPEFSVQSAINLYDYFLSIYITDIRWSFSILDVFVLIQQFFQNEESFLKKLTSITYDILLILFNQEKNQLKKQVNDKKLIDGQKRNLLLVFLKMIAQQNIHINIIPKIVKYYQLLQSLKKVTQQNIFKKVLSFFGDAEHLLNTPMKNELDKTQKHLNNTAFKNQDLISEISLQSAQQEQDNSLNNIYIPLQSNLKLPKINKSINSSSRSYDKNERYFMNKNQEFIQNMQKMQKETGKKISYYDYVKSQRKSLILTDLKSEKDKSVVEVKQRLETKSARSQNIQSQNQIIKDKQKKMVQKLLPLQDWDFLLPIDIESQNLVIKKYQSYIKYLFVRYTSGKNVIDLKIISFDQYSQSVQNLHPNEIFRLIKDLDWAKYVPRESFNMFIQFVNIRLSGKTIMTYDLKQFEQVLLYLSVFLISNEPFKQAHLPIGKQLDLMIQQLHKNIGQNDPQQDIFKTLFINDNIVLKNKTEKQVYQIQTQNKLPESLTNQIKNKNYLDCYEIVSEIFKNKFKADLVEDEFKIEETKRPFTPIKEKKIYQFKLITENSSIILGRKEGFKAGKVQDRSLSNQAKVQKLEVSFDLDNLNKFAQNQVQRQQEEQKKVQLKVFYLQSKNELFAKRQEEIQGFVKEHETEVKGSIKRHVEKNEYDRKQNFRDDDEKHQQYKEFLKSKREEVENYKKTKQNKKEQEQQEKENELQERISRSKKMQNIIQKNLEFKKKKSPSKEKKKPQEEQKQEKSQKDEVLKADLEEKRSKVIEFQDKRIQKQKDNLQLKEQMKEEEKQRYREENEKFKVQSEIKKKEYEKLKFQRQNELNEKKKVQ